MHRLVVYFIVLFSICFSAVAEVADKPNMEKLRVGFRALPGFTEIDSGGKRSGYAYEYMQCLRFYGNFEYEYVGYDKSWHELLKMLASGEIDLLCGVDKTPERLKVFDFSTQAMGDAHTILTLRHDTPAAKLKDQNLKVGFLNNDNRATFFAGYAKEKNITYTSVYFDRLPEMEQALQDGKVDALVTTSLRKVKNEWICDRFEPRQFFIALNKNKPHLQEQIDGALLKMLNDYADLDDELQQRYFAQNTDSDLIIPFLAAERNFIADCKNRKQVFYALVNPERIPFSYFENGELKGIMSEFAKRIIAASELDIRIIETKTFSEYAEAMKSGKADIVFDAGFDYSAAERYNMLLTKPYFVATVSLLHRAGAPNPPRTIGTSRTLELADVLIADTDKSIEVIKFNSINEVINAVYNGKVDAAWLYTKTAEAAISNAHFVELTSEILTEHATAFSIAVNRNSAPELAAIMQKSIAGLPSAEVEKILADTARPLVKYFSIYQWMAHNLILTISIIAAIFSMVAGSLLISLLAQRKNYRNTAIIGQLPLKYLVIDKKFNILMFSKFDATLFRKQQKKLSVNDIADPDFAQYMRSNVQKVFDTKESLTVNFRRNGSGRTASIELLPEKLFGIPTAIWISQDTTELQNMRTRSELLAERIELTLKSIGDGVVVTDAEGKVTLMNPVAEQLTGLTQGEAEGKLYSSIYNVVQTETNNPAVSSLEQALKAGASSKVASHIELISKDGNHYHISDSAAPIYDAEKQLIGSIWVFHNINNEYQQKKKLQEAFEDAQKLNTELQDLLAQHNIILDSIPAYIYAADINNDLRYTMVNKCFTEFLNLPEAQIIGHNDWDLFGENPELRMIHQTAKDAINTDVLKTAVMPLHDRNGKAITGMFCWKRLSLSGNRQWLFGMMLNITEQENAKQEAIEVSEWLRLTLNSIGDGVIATDAKGNIVQMNPVAERMVGCKMSEAVGKPHEEIFNIVSAMDHEPMSSPVRRSLRTGNIVELANHTDLVSKNGKCYHIADSAAPILNTKKEIIGAILVFRDVSEEYANREKLRAALTGLEYASQLSQAAYFRMSLKDRTMHSYSKQFPELWPVHNGRAVESSEYVWPEDLAAFQAVSDEIIFGRCGDSIWKFRAMVNNDLRYFQIKAALDNSEHNDPVLVGVIQDVSGIANDAARFKESQELWGELINSISTGVFAKDVNQELRYVLCNRAFSEFMGLTPEEIVGKTDADIFKESQEAAKYLTQDLTVIKNNTEMAFEEESIACDGTVHTLRKVKKIFDGHSGRKLLLGTSIDVTELLDMVRHEQINGEVLANAVLEPDFGKIIRNIANIILSTLHADRAVFASCDDSGKLALFAEEHSDKLESIFKSGVQNYADLWNTHLERFRNKQIILYENLRSVPEFQAFLTKFPALPSRSFAAVPVFIGQEFCGVLMVAFTTPHTFQKSDENFMRSMGNVVALALIRERQNLAVKQYEYENQMILDKVNIPLMLFNTAGKIVRANASAQAWLGNIDSDIPYICCKLKNCQLQSDECPVAKTFITGKPQQHFEQFNGVDYIIDARPLLDDNGNVINTVVSAFDISKQQNLLHNQQVINDCLANLVREGDMKRAIELSLKEICTRIGAEHCYIFQFDTEEKNISCFSEYSDDGKTILFEQYQKYAYSTEPNFEARFADNDILAFPDLANTYQADGLNSFEDFIIKHQVKSLYTHKIMLNNKFWGYVGLLFCREARELSEDEVKFFGSVAFCIELMLVRSEFQKQILSALEQAKTAEKAKSMFLASMSHEIRTPLNAVIGFAELLKSDALPTDVQQDYLNGISEAGNALLALINDVLDLSKLEAGQVAFVPEQVDFAELLNELNSIFRQKCIEKGLFLNLDVAKNMPLIWIDKLRVRQILFNLIGNAVKFTSQGGITVKADFTAQNETDGILNFTVIDTGCGISEADQKNLFQLFVQANAIRGTKMADGGTGLGLAICQRLAGKMDGEINLTSKLGEGSAFSVTLKSIKYNAATHSEIKHKAETVNIPPLKDINVLALDDVAMNLKVIAALLRNLGVTAWVASNTDEAMRILAENKIDSILTDLWMPGMNGGEFAASVRRNPKYAKIKIAAVTADTQSTDNFDMSVFDAVLPKPITGAKLREFLAKTEAK